MPNWVSLLLAVPVILLLTKGSVKSRVDKVARLDERVLIIGATSGIGRSLAHKYAILGAKVCVVGRRGDLVEEVVRECREEHKSSGTIGLQADFTNAEDLVRLRDRLEQEWKGIDTLLVIAGVSALQPLLDITGKEGSVSGIQRAIDIGSAAISANYMGPLATAATFVPVLLRTSSSPSILLLSSLAAVVPAPTRSIYCSTKSASLLLYQSLAIEHPEIKFSFVIPATVEGNFRASAVDASVGGVREADPSVHGLKREIVADACIRAVDGGTRTVFLPGTMVIAPWLYSLWPAFIEKKARKKYNF